ncbi:uncharacterized protein B0H64DRAFT_398245 [Chaetomium fimeti]|uniref:2EXR domain-containing protein n=1 Tax=Chaetomium fimeti TaxID=1854472 RepID=A0AAE0LT09_9PEZI|nr:hypothetical protein B0H64DRAFT_398245 [Chaetomium fimeti]
MTTATFHPFPRLPFELRSRIWGLTVEPRTVHVRVRHNEALVTNDAPNGRRTRRRGKRPSHVMAQVPRLVTSTPVPATLQLNLPRNSEPRPVPTGLLRTDHTGDTLCLAEFGDRYDFHRHIVPFGTLQTGCTSDQATEDGAGKYRREFLLLRSKRNSQLCQCHANSRRVWRRDRSMASGIMGAPLAVWEGKPFPH